MEFLKDDGLSFCSFFDIKALCNEEKNPNEANLKKSENEGGVYLNSTKENEKVMILYAKGKAQKNPA